MLDGWLVIFTGPKLIDELRRSPDEELSADEGVAEVSPSIRCAVTRSAEVKLRVVPDSHARAWLIIIGPPTAAYPRTGSR